MQSRVLEFSAPFGQKTGLSVDSAWAPASVREFAAYSVATFAPRPRAPVSPSGWWHCRWRWRSPSPRDSRRRPGIYCAIVTGFLISALGGSRYQIGGPTGAFVVVVAGIVAEHGVERPVHVHDDGRRLAGHTGRHGDGKRRQVSAAASRVGFTNGIAVLIASTQIKDFFGLDLAGRSGGVRGADGRARATRQRRSRRRRRSSASARFSG